MRVAPVSTRAALRRRVLAGLLVAGALLSAGPAAHAAAEGDDPNLDQTIAADEAVVRGARTLSSGHVDMGPRFVDGSWTFLIHDDVAKVDPSLTSVWRYPDETVLQVVDAAQLTAPDDAAYAFLGAEPGSTVWVVPQTQNPDVVWVGWNTQDPEVMARIDRGITLTLDAVEGPGAMSVYLQSGSFGAPQVLWDSRTPEPQSVWVDVNTHTHANWVFTAPGVYLVELTAEATLQGGATVSDTRRIRFAVGSQTPVDAALGATWTGSEQGPPAAAAPASDDDPLVPILAGAIGAVAVAIVAGAVVVIVRGRRARREALRADATAAVAPDRRPGAETKEAS
ncbi:MAG: choice-of-anchor M domain-containing protein [Microbacterium sp.]|uniref:choice-of-anchor M domain-containing protein n=1 Tax=Microbacterium sp. TaxID=51671 RepID=UPI001AD41A32|nr:choice-of-anchor M domain-containing protein [Microbacterium sp.]MBN9177983.1 choice-of-anchor M domain-containing protein [Microbacterium sp.]